MTSNQPEATMTHDGDVELVTRTLQGDAVAFETLVERYQQAVHAVCVSILHDFDLAQDLTQEAFLKALQIPPPPRHPGRFGNWLRIIAVNECRLYIRRKQAIVRPLCSFYDQTPGIKRIACQWSSNRSYTSSRTSTTGWASRPCRRWNDCQTRIARPSRCIISVAIA